MHAEILKQCYKLADKVIIVIGSASAGRSTRNPFTFEERKEMIAKFLHEEKLIKPLNTAFIYMRDSAYNFHDWLIQVKHEVFIQADKQLLISQDDSTALMGYYKDDSSYYLNYFPEWPLEKAITTNSNLHATDIRNSYFEDVDFEKMLSMVPKSIATYLSTWKTKKEYTTLVEEYAFIKKYKEAWKAAPYPPTFVTVDAVVIKLNALLVIKRGRNPGKGLYALPGGFLDQHEQIEDGCIRELKEETNIGLSIPSLKNHITASHVFDHPLRDPRGRTISHTFLFDLNDIPRINVSAADDASEVCWMPLHEIEKNEHLFFGDHAQIAKFFIAKGLK